MDLYAFLSGIWSIKAGNTTAIFQRRQIGEMKFFWLIFSVFFAGMLEHSLPFPELKKN